MFDLSCETLKNNNNNTIILKDIVPDRVVDIIIIKGGDTLKMTDGC